MEVITKEDLIRMVKSYNETEVDWIKKAYDYANDLHFGQTRQSGEPYITHPLSVAYILAEMHADRDTLCAALLHDTLEDTKTSKEEISELFNKEIANLVNGVTKISKMNFSSKQEQNMANTRKIITSLTSDVRIIIIKLADRLHNMRTLQFKSEFKQKENALETMEIFVPLAYYIGAYRLKSELEDLSLQYLKPDIYQHLEEKKKRIEEDSQATLVEMLTNIKSILEDHSIPNEIKVRTKNIYGIYKRLQEGHQLSNIHDLLALKIMVQKELDCYKSLGFIHKLYHPINDKFKDYICNPKTNMYQSLHTTVFGAGERLVQTQIRTFNMDKIASFGLTAYWDINRGKAREKMQEDLAQKYQFFQSLLEINHVFFDNQAFVEQVKAELFTDKVYVYTPKGEVVELPKGSTPIDFAYEIDSELGNTMVSALVNDRQVDVGYELQNKDRVRILTDPLSFGPRESWLTKVKTTKAKQKLLQMKQALK